MSDLFAFVFTYTGGVIWWLLKGLKNPLESEISATHDRDFKFVRNLVTGLAAFAILLLTINKFL